MIHKTDIEFVVNTIRFFLKSFDFEKAEYEDDEVTCYRKGSTEPFGASEYIPSSPTRKFWLFMEEIAQFYLGDETLVVMRDAHKADCIHATEGRCLHGVPECPPDCCEYLTTPYTGVESTTEEECCQCNLSLPEGEVLYCDECNEPTCTTCMRYICGGTLMGCSEECVNLLDEYC